MARFSGNDRSYDLSGDVCQSKIPPLVTIGQALVVNSQLMEDRGLHIVNSDWVLNDFIAEIICLAVHFATLEASSGNP